MIASDRTPVTLEGWISACLANGFKGTAWGTQRFLEEKYAKVLNPQKTEAPELSYLFDFIDIDESGQVNLEELLSQSIWKFAGFLSNTVFSATLSCFSLQGNSLLGNRL